MPRRAVSPTPALPLSCQKNGEACKKYVNTAVCDVCTFHASQKLKQENAAAAAAAKGGANKGKSAGKAATPAGKTTNIAGGLRGPGAGVVPPRGGAPAGPRGAGAGGGGMYGGFQGPGGFNTEAGIRMIETAILFGLELRGDGSLRLPAQRSEEQVPYRPRLVLSHAPRRAHTPSCPPLPPPRLCSRLLCVVW